MGEGDASLKRLLFVFRGNPCGREGLRGGRNETEAADDFLDISLGGSLSLYEGRRESVELSGPAVEAVVAVLGAVEVLLDATRSSCLEEVLK